MKISKTEDGYQLVCKKSKTDFHIRREKSGRRFSWFVDEFDSTESDPNNGHIESSEHRTLDAALKFVLSSNK